MLLHGKYVGARKFNMCQYNAVVVSQMCPNLQLEDIWRTFLGCLWQSGSL